MPPVTVALQQLNSKLNVKNANNYSWSPIFDVKMYIFESLMQFNKQVLNSTFNLFINIGHTSEACNLDGINKFKFFEFVG